MSKFDTGTAKNMPAENKSSENGAIFAVKSGLQNKKVQVSLAGVVALAACGAVGYALTRPSNRRRLSRYSDQISGYIPGMSSKTTLPERLANQIVDLVDATFKR